MTEHGGRFEIVRMDCVEWLRSIEDESVDLLVSDPAYRSLERHRAVGTTTRLTADWFETIPNERWVELMAECYRVLKPDAHAYIIADEETTYDVTRPTAIAAGFTWKKALVWVKTKGTTDVDELVPGGVNIGMGYSWRASKEHVAYLEKGKRRLRNLGWPDVLPFPPIRATERSYATEKPVPLLRRLIENSSEPGELVIDPFMGSGSTGEAALVSGRRFAGCDVAERSVTLSRTRLAALGVPGGVGPCPEGRVLTPRRPVAQGSLFA